MCGIMLSTVDDDVDFVVKKEQAIDKKVTVIRRGKKTYHVINHVL